MLTKIFQKSSLKSNIVANVSGNASMAFLNFLFIPVYLKYIGSEGYGLIGVFTSIQSLLYVLDSGFSTTLNRELASLSAGTGKKQQIINLVKTLESIYWPVAILVGIIAIITSYFLAHSWIQSQGLSEQTVFQAFLILSITFVFQFPVGFYAGGLLGLQRHVLFNTIRVFFALLKNVGALLILMFYSTSVIVFFSWNLGITVLTVLVFRIVLKKLTFEGGMRARFDKIELRRVAKFSGGMAAIALSGTLMMQVDKVILSKTLLLSDFGYYTIAVTLGMAVLQVIGPISQSFFPKFSHLASLKDKEQLKETYHRGTQLVSILIFPASLVIIFYCKEVLMLWTHSQETVDKTHYITRLFAIGTTINAMVSILFAFVFALNWNRFIFYMSVSNTFILTPMIALFTWNYGPAGAAFFWIFINIIYLAVIPFIIHNKFFKADLLRWYWSDTFKPLVGCLAFLTMVYFLFPTNNFSDLELLSFLIIIGAMAVGITVLCSHKIKSDIYSLVVRKKAL